MSFRHIVFSDNGMLSPFRVKRMSMTWEMLKDRPLVGAGFHHFTLLFDQYNPDPGPRDRRRIAANMYLTLLAETGALGFGAFLVFLGCLARSGCRACFTTRAPPQKTLLLISLASLVGLLAGMVGYELLYWTSPLLLFCLLCGFLAGLTAQTRAIDPAGAVSVISGDMISGNRGLPVAGSAEESMVRTANRGDDR